MTDRSLFFLFALAFVPVVSAQQSTIHTFQAATGLDGALAKRAHAVVLELSPSAKVSIDGRILKVASPVALGTEQLIDALNSTGATYSVVEVGAERTHVQDAPPVFVMTGDQEADIARYKEAKRRWVEAHPDTYQRMLDPPASGATGTKTR